MYITQLHLTTKVCSLESPALKSFTSNGTEIFYRESGAADGPIILWGHGWGHSHAALDGITSSLDRQARHISFDFPGFGASPKPSGDWGTEDYADAIADFIQRKIGAPVYWGGHSFGGRVALQLAAKHPELVRGLFIIAGAGLQRKRSALDKTRFKIKVYTYKTLKFLTKFGLSKDWLQSKFGSSDYKNAGAMRGIFVKTVNEDLTEKAQLVQCPTLLFYGANDIDAPPEFGERLKRLISHAELYILDGQDHYSVLSSGRHFITSKINAFLKDTK